MEYCQLCLWNGSYVIFNDDEYSDPKKGTEFYRIKLLTGYNWVINPNCYNKVSVCHECLLDGIYMCNFELKYNVLEELKVNMAIRVILSKKNLPNEMFGEIYKYLYL